MRAYRDSRCPIEVDSLARFDFSGAKAILIPSVPGRHVAPTMHRYGHMKMRSILGRQVLPQKFHQAPVVAQYSSVGSVSEEWLTGELRVSLAAHAKPAAAAATTAAPKKHKAAAANANTALTAAASSSALPPIHLIWPSMEVVRTSLEGWSAGGSLCCDTKNMKPWMHKYLHVWDGVGQGRHRASPHIKSYLRAAPDGELAWCLITSANCSNAAWGQLQKDGTQLQIRHWELGVLFHPAHFARAMQILKARKQVNFSCTPDQPIIYSPKGPLSSLPYYASAHAPQHGAAAAASSSSSSALPMPPPPTVRFVLLPDVTSHASTTASTAAAASAPGCKRKLRSTDFTDLTGEEDDKEAAEEGQDASSSAIAKRTRLHSPLPTPASSAQISTDLARSNSVASAAAAASSSAASVAASRVHTVICPIPYNVHSRPYSAHDKPWVWDVDCLEPDTHGFTRTVEKH